MNFASKFLGGHRPGHSAYLVRRLQRGRLRRSSASTNMPEFGILPTTEPRHTGADAQPVGPRPHARRLLRRLGGRGRLRHAADRARQRRRRLASASPPRAAAWSASSPAAGASRAGRTSATRSWPATACSPARWPRPRSCSTCSPATRSATRPGRRGRPSRTRLAAAPRSRPPAGGDDRRQPARRRRRPRVRARHARDGASCSPARPRGRGGGAVAPRQGHAAAVHPAPSARAIALGIAYGELLAGRPPEDDEIEPLSRALARAWRKNMPSVELPRRRSPSCRRSPAAWSRSSPSTTCC